MALNVSITDVAFTLVIKHVDGGKVTKLSMPAGTVNMHDGKTFVKLSRRSNATRRLMTCTALQEGCFKDEAFQVLGQTTVIDELANAREKTTKTLVAGSRARELKARWRRNKTWQTRLDALPDVITVDTPEIPGVEPTQVNIVPIKQQVSGGFRAVSMEITDDSISWLTRAVKAQFEDDDVTGKRRAKRCKLQSDDDNDDDDTDGDVAGGDSDDEGGDDQGASNDNDAADHAESSDDAGEPRSSDDQPSTPSAVATPSQTSQHKSPLRAAKSVIDYLMGKK
jgi:hypothetical protein